MGNIIEHLPPRITPRVSLPIKEQNKNDNAKASRTFPRASLPIKKENEYNNTKEPWSYRHVVDDTKKEYEYDNTKEYTTKNVKKKIKVTEKK